jgi:hypothetical protein
MRGLVVVATVLAAGVELVETLRIVLARAGRLHE